MFQKIRFLLSIAILLSALTGCTAKDEAYNNLDQNDTRLTQVNNRNNNWRYSSVPMSNNNGNSQTDISATKTHLNSDKFPHTKAIVIQHAKYKYVPVDQGKVGDQLKGQINNRISLGLQRFGLDTGTPPADETQENWTTPSPNTGGPSTEPNVETPTAPPDTGAKGTEQTPATPNENREKGEQDTDQNVTEQNEAQTGISEFAQRVIDLTNQERRQAGLSPLKADAELSKVAQIKTEDMEKNNYFSHTSPTYGSPFDMMRDFGIEYKSAGENIAQGQRTPEEVVKAWMNSPGHKANILSKDFTHIGVGFESNGYHWTQMFIKK